MQGFTFVYSILQGLRDKPQICLVKPINTPYMRFSPPTKTIETATSLVRLGRFAFRDSPITRMRLVDPNQRLVTGLKCNHCPSIMVT